MAIFGKGSKLYSIFRFKCPRCHQGEVFQSNNPYNLKRMFQMKETCDHCGFRFEFEPGFFYGAMYVSYGYTVAIFVAIYVLMNLFFEPGIWEVVLALSLILVLGSPLIFRLSRITYLNLFVKYDPDKRGAKLK